MSAAHEGADSDQMIQMRSLACGGLPTDKGGGIASCLAGFAVSTKTDPRSQATTYSATAIRAGSFACTCPTARSSVVETVAPQTLSLEQGHVAPQQQEHMFDEGTAAVARQVNDDAGVAKSENAITN